MALLIAAISIYGFDMDATKECAALQSHTRRSKPGSVFLFLSSYRVQNKEAACILHPTSSSMLRLLP